MNLSKNPHPKVAAATEYIRVKGVQDPWTCPLWTPTRYKAQRAKRWWRSTLIDSGRPLVWTIPVDSDGSLMWDRCHWKLYEILFPSIYETSKTESICVLGINLVRLAPGFRSGVEVELGLGSRAMWTS